MIYWEMNSACSPLSLTCSLLKVLRTLSSRTLELLGQHARGDPSEEDQRLALHYNIDDPQLGSYSAFNDDTGSDCSYFQTLCHSSNDRFMNSQ